MSPVPTGQWIELPYIPGCRYVAFKAAEAHHEQVNIYILNDDKVNNLINSDDYSFLPPIKA